FGDEREVFTMEEAIERFDITQVNPANSAFPIEKLDWLNGLYIREKTTVEELAQLLREPLEAAGLEVDMDLLLRITPLVQTRIKILSEVVDLAGFFFHKEFRPPQVEDLIQKKMDVASTKAALEAAASLLESLEPFDHETQYEAMKQLAKELGLKNTQMFGALRVAVTGQRISTPTFETMEILGKEESLRRIRLAIEMLADKQA
ncbi:MAG: glutamate--tRNA ligase, partial [Chloroflexi bacterium]